MRRGSLLVLLVAAVVLVAAAPPPVLGRRGVVATDHPACSAAAASVLAAGGNAVDGAVAAALACGVVQPAGSGLGGGGFAVVVEPGEPGRTPVSHVLDFREVAPAAAFREMYVQAPPGASRKGGLSVAVPGEPRGLAELHARWGRLPLGRVARPAIRLARRGFAVGHHLAGALADAPSALVPALFPGAALPIREGDRVRRPRLARTLAAFARGGGEVLARGPLAEDLVDAVRAAGGLLTLDDLAAYRPKDRAPLVGRYRGWTVITMPPPSSGGVVLLQVLRVLEGWDLAALGWNSAALFHLEAEAMQHAFADRARWMGDPDRVAVPVDALLSDARVAAVRAAIDPDRTFGPEHYGMPVDAGTDAGTQHISVLDAEGMAVALTTTINTAFGSGVVAPRSGIVLNDEMDDFVARPGEPNAYGLLGSEANAVAPGARPLSSMTPTVLLSPDGRQRIALGASGGPTIISATLQAIVGIVDFDLDIAEAVAAPRIHHQWMPHLLYADVGVSPDTVRLLEERGHAVRVRPAFSAVQVARVRGLGGPDPEFRGASDPRKGGRAAGVP